MAILICFTIALVVFISTLWIHYEHETIIRIISGLAALIFFCCAIASAVEAVKNIFGF